MGTIQTVSGADFSANAIGYNAPNTRGLVGLFLPGNTLAQSLKNLLAGGVAAAALLTPAVSPGYISGAAGSGVQTSISDTPSLTWIAAVRAPVLGTGNPTFNYYFGTTSGSTTGVGVYTGAAAAFNAYGFYTPSGGGTAVNKAAQVAMSAVNTWQLIAFVQDNAAGTIQLFNLTTGVTGVATATGGTLVPGTTPIQFGTAPAAKNGNFQGDSDIALFEAHNVALSLAELQAIYAAFKPVLANRGIAV